MNTFSKVRSLLTPDEQKGALILFALMLVGTVLETLGVTVVIPAITLLVQRDLSKYARLAPWLHLLGNPTQAQLVRGGMLVLVSVYFVKTLFLGFLAWRQTKFTYRVQLQMSHRLFSIYLRQPYTFHLQRNSAQLHHNISGEVVMFSGVLSAVMSFTTESLVLISIASLLLIVQPRGALSVVLVLGSASWAFYGVTRTRLSRWGAARQHHEGFRARQLLQGLGGAKEVILLGRQDDFLAQYDVHSAQVARVGQLQATIQQLPRLWLEFLGVAGLTTLVLVELAQHVEIASIVPTLGLFAVAAFRLMPSVNRVLGAMQTLRYSGSVIDTLYKESALPVIEVVHTGDTARPLRNRIQLTNVSYRYASSPTLALNDVSLEMHRGELIGFIGPSGSGKSTLVDVILGLLTPLNGQVLVDEWDIQEHLRAWQNQIGYVSQHVYLIDDTLSSNVGFGIPADQMDETAVKRALRAAQLEDFVATLPLGVNTIVGERGVRLSGGQRQRIGIARALYTDPDVLVLDEATSALDGATERGVMQAVTALRESKTILVVAHRLSTVEHCDRLYRLEQGRVVAEGTPAEMLSPTKILASG